MPYGEGNEYRDGNGYADERGHSEGRATGKGSENSFGIGCKLGFQDSSGIGRGEVDGVGEDLCGYGFNADYYDPELHTPFSD